MDIFAMDESILQISVSVSIFLFLWLKIFKCKFILKSEILMICQQVDQLLIILIILLALRSGNCVYFGDFIEVRCLKGYIVFFEAHTVVQLFDSWTFSFFISFTEWHQNRTTIVLICLPFIEFCWWCLILLLLWCATEYRASMNNIFHICRNNNRNTVGFVYFSNATIKTVDW